MQGTGKPYRVRIDREAHYAERFVVEYLSPHYGGTWTPMWIVTKHAEAMRLAHIGARIKLGWSQHDAVSPCRYRGVKH